MDDRCELYGDEWIKTYSDTLGLPPAKLGPVFEGWAGRYGFRRAIVVTDPTGREKPPIEQYLAASAGWGCIWKSRSRRPTLKVHSDGTPPVKGLLRFHSR